MKVENAIGFSKKVQQFDPEPRLPLPYELIGIELEYEGVTDGGLAGAPTLWSAVMDGSLRNNGIEYVLTEPLYGTGITDALSSMAEHVGSIRPDVSNRCSVHVHVNVSDMDIDQLLTMVLLYLVFERTIIKYHGTVREDNIFCVPYYRAPEALNKLITLFSGLDAINASSVGQLLSSFNKYHGLNIGAIATHGSLEFRHMSGTTDMAKVDDWICIIQHLKRAALEMQVDYMQIINNMSGSTHNILEEVFKEHKYLLENLVTPDDLVQGARLAQRVVGGNDLEIVTYKESNRRINKVTTAKIDNLRKSITGKKKKQPVVNEAPQALEDFTWAPIPPTTANIGQLEITQDQIELFTRAIRGEE